MNQASTQKTLLYKCLRPDYTWNSKSWLIRFIAQVSNFSSRKSTRAVCFWKGIQNSASWVSCSIGVERGPIYSRAAVLNLFGIRDQFCGRQFFHRGVGGNGCWFQDDSSPLHLLGTLFLLLLHQLHIRSSGIRSQRLGIPVPGEGSWSFVWWDSYSFYQATMLAFLRNDPFRSKLPRQNETTNSKCYYSIFKISATSFMSFTNFEGRA